MGIYFRKRPSSGNITLLSNPSNSNSNPSVSVDGSSSDNVVSPYIYSDGIDLNALSAVQFNGAPAVTLRAAGDLIINGSLSAGFAAPVASPDGPIFAISPLAGGPSWSLNLVAGANLAAADPLAHTQLNHTCLRHFHDSNGRSVGLDHL
jgi:hypothetical protein